MGKLKFLVILGPCQIFRFQVTSILPRPYFSLKIVKNEPAQTITSPSQYDPGTLLAASSFLRDFQDVYLHKNLPIFQPRVSKNLNMLKGVAGTPLEKASHFVPLVRVYPTLRTTPRQQVKCYNHQLSEMNIRCTTRVKMW